MTSKTYGWIVKCGKAYESSAEFCNAESGWCCLRRHARVHLTLDSARHARDGIVIAALSEMSKSLWRGFASQSADAS